MAISRVIRGDDGPVALHTQLGWVLTGPASFVDGVSTTSLVALSLKPSSTHSKELEKQLKTFWELEALGILDKESHFMSNLSTILSLSMVDMKYHFLGEVPFWISPLITN